METVYRDVNSAGVAEHARFEVELGLGASPQHRLMEIRWMDAN